MNTMNNTVGRESVDLEALAAELDAIRADILEHQGEEDLAHLMKLERWGRAFTALGYATGWIAPNPVSAVALSLGSFARWTVVGHPVCHKAYDKIEETPARLTSKTFAKGGRRWIDWLDWILPDAWHEEHDILHHYNLGEAVDPDVVQVNFEWLRDSSLPMPLRYALVAVLASTWKFSYYAPNTLKEYRAVLARRAGEAGHVGTLLSWRPWVPLTPEGRQLWFSSYLPYAGLKFVAAPALFLGLGPLASANVLANSLMAELLTNLHSFVAIVPNHCGEDIPSFDEPTSSKGEFYFRQIVGSVNYETGGDWNDFLHGWLNYQIEHHLWPEAPLKQLQRVQPRVKAACERHGVPYLQESVWTRVRKTVDVMVGKATQPRWRRGAAA